MRRARVGGVLTDVALGTAGVSLTGELATDAAVGAVALGGATEVPRRIDDEAGEAARSWAGAVANTTSAYAELAAVNAELALLEQQARVQGAIDEKVAEVKAIPGKVQGRRRRSSARRSRASDRRSMRSSRQPGGA